MSPGWCSVKAIRMTPEYPLPGQNASGPVERATSGRTTTHGPSGGGLDLQSMMSEALAVARSDLEVHCGLSVSSSGRAIETLASTSDIPVRVDWLQHELQQGPGVSAAEGEVFESSDLAEDARWRDFGRMCAAVLNLRGMVSIRVPVPGADRVRLNFWAPDPSALENLDVNGGIRLAHLVVPTVATALGGLQHTPPESGRDDHSRVAVALSTIMARYRLTSARAFEVLLQAPRDLGRTLVDIAREVVDTGVLPAEALPAAGLRSVHGTTGLAAGHSATRARPRNEAGRAWVRTHHRVSPSEGRESGDPNVRPDQIHLNIGGPEMWREPPSAAGV